MKPDALKLLIESGNPVISLETADELRGERVVRAAAEQLGLPLFEWSVTDGLRKMTPQLSQHLVPPNKVVQALTYVKDAKDPAVFLFKDVGAHCKDPQVVRILRDLYYKPDSRVWTLVLLEGIGLPPEVRRLTVPFDIGWPDYAELDEVVRQTFTNARLRSLRKIEAHLNKRQFEQLVQSLRGLTTEEAARVVSAAIHDDDVLDAADLPKIIDAKRNRLGTLGCLETIIADFNPEDIGGLHNLKRWLGLRRGGFSTKAREFGLDPPRGILLLGVQGCGKSLCAKVVAAGWNMPLLRMDPGVMYQKFVGESEARLREALGQAESMAPAVLWIDEIEKAFASAHSPSADGGLSQRMFGTLLSWMQDHRHPIFLIATANNISQLPPELMRKGRFDEVFFVDLPSDQDRRGIFSIHLERRRRDPAQFDLTALAAAAEGFTGAEIEEAVVTGLYAAFSNNADCGTEHVLEAIRQTQPLSVLMHEDVQQLRTWAQGRCVPAD
ncbi:MAG: AAA family ATPase [Pirellulales bacterium]|nr:AAA family ATPase [Pirellulales bacterium]